MSDEIMKVAYPRAATCGRRLDGLNFSARKSNKMERALGYRNLRLETEEGIATLTLNRPDLMNPLDRETTTELLSAFRAIETNSFTRIVIITGAGKAFSAGGDLQGYLSLYRAPNRFRIFLDDLHDLLVGFENSDRIMIAAVNGWCLAGGLELMLACDLAVASDQAQLGDAHLNYAQLPGAGGSQRLPRAIGIPRAKDLILTGRRVGANEALSLGLISRVFPHDRLMMETRKLAAEMMERSSVGLKGAKHLIAEGMKMPLDKALRFEIDFVHQYATNCPDAYEGLLAFNEKRKPRFHDN
jgi:enoyl-CoA hydratase/carnithine racemase